MNLSMNNNQLINYLHTVYPELPINIHKIKGYSDDEIKKFERLYRINVTEQLYDFLSCMGRCSGGFLGWSFHYDANTGEYISVKTLNTQTASRIKNPKSIENTLNTYISTIDKYSGERRGRAEILPSDVKSKTLELGVPARTTKEQWDAINDSIKNASSKNIKINITIVEE